MLPTNKELKFMRAFNRILFSPKPGCSSSEQTQRSSLLYYWYNYSANSFIEGVRLIIRVIHYGILINPTPPGRWLYIWASKSLHNKYSQQDYGDENIINPSMDMLSSRTSQSLQLVQAALLLTGPAALLMGYVSTFYINIVTHPAISHYYL